MATRRVKDWAKNKKAPKGVNGKTGAVPPDVQAAIDAQFDRNWHKRDETEEESEEEPETGAE